MNGYSSTSDDGTPAPEDDVRSAGPLEPAVLAALATAPLTRADLRARLRVRNERLGETLTRLADLGAVRRVGDRWTVPDSHSRPP